jgi:hypothetical protein
MNDAFVVHDYQAGEIIRSDMQMLAFNISLYVGRN